MIFNKLPLSTRLCNITAACKQWLHLCQAEDQWCTVTLTDSPLWASKISHSKLENIINRASRVSLLTRRKRPRPIQQLDCATPPGQTFNTCAL